MNLLDLLLSTEPEKFSEWPKAKVKIKRLSEICGKDFEVEVRAISQRDLNDMPSTDSTAYTLLRCITNLDFTSDALREKLKPQGRATPLTPAEAVERLFLPGEINTLYKTIFDISGFGSDAAKKIEKN